MQSILEIHNQKKSILPWQREIENFSKVLSYPVQLRALKGIPKNKIVGNSEEFCSYVERLNGRRQIYYTLNAFEGPIKGVGVSDQDITHRKWFFIDVDSEIRPKDQNSTIKELKETGRVAIQVAKELLERGVDGYLIRTGNGYCILVRLPDYPNNSDTDHKYQRLLDYFCENFSSKNAKIDLSVKNPARICRVPGTKNIKGSHSFERPQRFCRIVHQPEEPFVTYDLFSIFEKEISNQLLTMPDEELPRKISPDMKGDLSTYDIVRHFQDNGMYGKQDRKDLNKHSVVCPWSEGHSCGTDGDSSTVVWGAENGNWPVFHCSHQHCEEYKLRDVIDYFGGKEVTNYCSQPYPSGDSSDNKQPVGPALQFTSLKKLFEEPEEEIFYLVEGLLPDGGLSIWVAKPKTGKTTAARQLALCVANGDPFLGLETKKGTSLYINLEDRKVDFMNHFRSMGASEDEENVSIYYGPPPDNWEKGLEEAISEHSPKLVIVDTLARLTGIEEINDYSEVTRSLQPLLNLARKYSVHIAMVHHANKGSSDEINSILGSTALAGTVDTIVLMWREKDNSRVIKTIQRVGEELDPTVLELGEDRKLYIAGKKEEVEFKKIKEKVRVFINSTDEKVETARVCKEIEGRNKSISDALRKLFDEGEIEREGEGKKGSPYIYSRKKENAVYVIPALGS